MFLKKIMAAFSAALLLALGACGGGGDDVAVSAPAPVVAAPARAEAAVTFNQQSTSLTVLPGGTVSAIVLEATCKGASVEGYCPNAAILGQVLLQSSIELIKAKFSWSDGSRIEGYFRNEGGGTYRFVPNGSYAVWRRDTMTVDLTPSPYTKAGEYTLLVLDVGSPAPDKKIEVVGGTASLTVREAPGNAPMLITTSDAYQSLIFSDKSAPYVEYSVKAECANGTQCDFGMNFDYVTGLQPGTPVQLCNYRGCWDEAYADEQGMVSFGLWRNREGGNALYIIRLYPNTEYVANNWQFRLIATSITSWVGGKEILPKLESATAPSTLCTVADSTRNCKGAKKPGGQEAI